MIDSDWYKRVGLRSRNLVRMAGAFIEQNEV